MFDIFCRCLPGIGGRKCDYCLPGFHAFPLCRECDCDRYGTREEICDLQTGYCLCKVSVWWLLPGFHAFPLCRECDCDRYGTGEEICDLQTGDKTFLFVGGIRITR